MKIVWLVSIVFFILAGPAAGGQAEPGLENTSETKTEFPAEPETDIKVFENKEFLSRMSYSLGYDIFSHVSGQVALDIDAFLDGIRDAQKKDPKLDETLMRQMLMAYQRMARKNEMDKVQKIRDENLARGGVFLEGNKLKQGVVSLSTGLQYKVLKQGNGPVPGPEDSVECHYRGRLLDGTEFDSSYSRGRPAVFQVSKVIAGWTQALTRMPVGSRWALYIPPDLAYGDQGAGDKIGPGATLVFEVELLGILE
ncbi:MAG: FKBP-type peptidyl-prolyl cis-trans isomerase [Desulfobacterales bacterium]|nr:FKBP-type peptidyl-prolyl cis-trans isomerase [Desulfobacterales bacterium]